MVDDRLKVGRSQINDVRGIVGEDARSKQQRRDGHRRNERRETHLVFVVVEVVVKEEGRKERGGRAVKRATSSLPSASYVGTGRFD